MTVEVDLEKKWVKWLVNGKLRAEIESPILRQSSREFAPVIGMYYTGDMVEYTE